MKTQIHRIKTALTRTRRRTVTSAVIAGTLVLVAWSTGTAAVALEVRQPKVVEVVVEEAVPTAMVDEAPAYVPLAWLDQEDVEELSELGSGATADTSTALIRLGDDRWIQIAASSPYLWESTAAREALTTGVLDVESYRWVQAASDTAAAVQKTSAARAVFLVRDGSYGNENAVSLIGAYRPVATDHWAGLMFDTVEEGRAALEAAEAGFKLDLTQF